MSRPGPQHEGDGAQRVHIKRCFLEDTAIGGSNKMTISPGAVGSGDSRRSPEEPEKDTGKLALRALCALFSSLPPIHLVVHSTIR
jgi:Z-DNA binding protein 1